MATHSSTLAWKIPWTEGPGGLQSMGLLGVGHDRATSLSLFTFMHWRRKWQPTPVFLPGESQGWGAWWAAVYGVAQSRTRLKWLSSSSSSSRAILNQKLLPIESWKWHLLKPSLCNHTQPFHLQLAQPQKCWTHDEPLHANRSSFPELNVKAGLSVYKNAWALFS